MGNYLAFDINFLRNTGAALTTREIDHQPLIWRQAFARVEQHRDELDNFLKPLLGKQSLRIILTGAGTSAVIGETLAPALSRRTGRVFEAVSTTDIVSAPADYLIRTQPTLLVSFARSGNSPESLAAIDLANQLIDDCHHLIITCNPNGHLARNGRIHHNRLCQLMPEGTNDKGFAMTSSYSTMMLYGLCTFSTSGLTRERIEQICTATKKMLTQDHEFLESLAARDFNRIVFLGSGCLQGLAKEAALNMLELTVGKVIALHDTPMGFRHGPKSMVDNNTLVILFMSNDLYTRNYDKDLLQELRREKKAGFILAVTSQNSAGVQTGYHYSFDIYKAQDDIWLAFPFIALAQILACFKSLHLGISPDTPCPTGEINRVVQGVKIYKFPHN